MSKLTLFLQGLFFEGTAMVGSGPVVPDPDAETEALLRRACLEDAWHFPGKQPAFDLGVATKAASWFYAAAMCYADRSMDAATAEALLQPPIVSRLDAVAHYSADLVLRHLPALHELASGLADGDPVLVSLKRMAWLWPLSSVGVQLPVAWGAPDTTVLQAHPGLWRLYLDRVISAGDPANLRDEATRAASRLSLGLHPSLAQRLQPHWGPAEPPALSPTLPSHLS